MTLLDRTHQFSSEAKWLDWRRRQGIGASEAAGVLGQSVFKDKTPFSIWQDKVDAKTDEPDAEARERFRWGHRMESAILEEYRFQRAKDSPMVMGQSLVSVVHAEFPRCFASPDALCVARDGDRWGLDAKWLGTWMRQHFGEPGTDEMPFDYVCQGLISCEVFAVPRWDFAILWSDKVYEEYTVQRSTEVATSLIVRLLEWWDDYVVGDKPPPIDGSEGARKFLASLYPENRRPLLPATAQAQDLARLSWMARQRAKEAEADQATADNALRQLVGDADGIDHVCTWKKAKDSERLDKDAYIAFLEHRLGKDDSRDPCAEWRAHHITTKPGSRRFLLTYKGE